jgi:hypothetical protein
LFACIFFSSGSGISKAGQGLGGNLYGFTLPSYRCK